MQQRLAVKGTGIWSAQEMSMWACCTSIWIFGMVMVRHMAHMDLFRVFFFGSPGLVTAMVAPFCKDKHFHKLCGLGAFLFIAYWMLLQAYPCQCRHAWGTMMFADNRFWNNEQAIRDALMTEKDTFYKVKELEGEEKNIFGLPARNKTLKRQFHGRQDADINRIFEVVKQMSNEQEQKDEQERQELEREQEQLAAGNGAAPAPPGQFGGGQPGWGRRLQQASPRVRKWIAPLTGAESMDILKLRAYCHIHANDDKLPAIFPFRAIGLPAHYTTTLPCPYWSCVMTEARWDGKLPFFVSFAFVAILNYIHYRLECHNCDVISCMLGSGQSRLWWGWFWASFLPLWVVMLLKTTYDEELTELIGNRLNELQSAVFGWLSSDSNKIFLAVLLLALLLAYVYWDKVRTFLGLEHHTFLPQLFSRVQEDGYERVIQVCVWRIDLSADDGNMEGLSPRGNVIEPEYSADSSNNRALPSMFSCSIAPRPGAGWIPLPDKMWKAEEDMTTIRTGDGRVPSLSVQFNYGSETLQYSRTVRPTWNEWRGKGSVYIQENFKIALDWRPGVPLRVEVRDTEAALGPVSLGETDFDSAKLSRQLELSNKALAQFTDVPVVQVIRMLEPPVPSNMPGRAREKISDLKTVGFQQHHLSGGGAIWLAFSEVKSEKGDGGFSCC